MKPIIYGIKYIIDHQIFNSNTPLICGLVVTNRCNLRCRHCRVVNRKSDDLSFEEISAAINSFYQQGGRSLYLEGGEPFIWRDRQYTLEDIVEHSHKIGFFTTIIYTNGTFPLQTSADTVFISIDGLEKTHDFLRGETFNRIMKNIHESEHPSLYINYTINQYNKDEIQEFCEHIHKVNQIQGIFFYFHTPYYGYDDLYLDRNQRNEILLKLLSYQKKYKILNSRAGIKSALRNDWKRPLDICRVYEKGKVYQCCRFPGDPELCENCGYLSYAEINQTLKLKPSAILNALKYY
jgi:MoaA/NifB/PqqE/SkfB family radical SAM enzyme